MVAVVYLWPKIVQVRMLQHFTGAFANNSQLVSLAGSRSGTCPRRCTAHQPGSSPASLRRNGCTNLRSIRFSTQCQHSLTQQASEKAQSPTQQQTKLKSHVSREVDSAISNAVDHCLTETKLAIGQQTVVKLIHIAHCCLKSCQTLL